MIDDIDREPPRAAPKMLPLRWLAWSGVCSLLVATGLTILLLPQQAGGRRDADFNSQVISVHAEVPSLSVSKFQAPDERGVVIWIEGADYIPAEAMMR
jgi:hypothetical protein